jgi:hypothetical protein
VLGFRDRLLVDTLHRRSVSANALMVETDPDETGLKCRQPGTGEKCFRRGGTSALLGDPPGLLMTWRRKTPRTFHFGR